MHYLLATCINASGASDRPEFVKQSLIQYHLCNDAAGEGWLAHQYLLAPSLISTTIVYIWRRTASASSI